MTRTVYPNDMVAHIWAHQSQDQARSNNGNLYFEGDTIYSYGSHFPIARHVDGVVLLTTDSYSVTTSAHVSRVAGACSHLTVFHVLHVCGHRHSDNFANYERRIEEALTKAARARTSTDWHLADAANLVAEANRYIALFRPGVPPLTMPDNLDEVRARAKRLAAEQAERTRRDNALRRERMAEDAQRWKDGEEKTMWGHPDTFMRIRGDVIETSKGAEFPVEHGRKAFGVIKRCHDAGKTYQRNGHSVPLGHFVIDSIDREGNVTAGCHFVKWTEVARVADLLGLT